MMALAVLIGAITIQGSFIPLTPVFLGFVTAFTLTGASMVANDYWDREVDVVNEPRRPIPSGRISSREAVVYAFIMAGIGLASAYLTNLACLLLALASLVISLTYNWRAKETGLLGNLMVSACVAIPFLYGGLIYEGLDTTRRQFELGISFASMAFLSNTGREVTKDIVDMEGDRVRDVGSVALKWGSRAAALVSALFYLLAILLSILVWIFQLVSWRYLPFVLIADAGFAWSAIALLKDSSGESAKRVKNMVLVWMLIGLLSFLGGGL